MGKEVGTRTENRLRQRPGHRQLGIGMECPDGLEISGLLARYIDVSVSYTPDGNVENLHYAA